MSGEQLTIEMKDGDCRAWAFRPDAGTGPWPAAIIFMDAFGMRPTLVAMGERLAQAGFVVLLPDLFYRAGAYAPIDPTPAFASGVRKAVWHLVETTSNRIAAEDAAAFLAYLDSRTDVQGTKVGTTGYCMGGGISLWAAATYPERIAAAASFHGGNLATDEPLSPHRVASKIKGFVYVAGADSDVIYPPEQAKLLDETLTTAGVRHRCEIYEGALHGWTMTDFPVYDEAAAARHWHELTALFARELG